MVGAPTLHRHLFMLPPKCSPFNSNEIPCDVKHAKKPLCLDSSSVFESMFLQLVFLVIWAVSLCTRLQKACVKRRCQALSWCIQVCGLAAESVPNHEPNRFTQFASYCKKVFWGGWVTVQCVFVICVFASACITV